MFAEKNNGKRTVNESIKDLDKMDFKAVKEFIGQDIVPCGYFFTTGKFGKQVVIVTRSCKLNVPKRYTEWFEGLSDDEREAFINEKCMMKDIHMQDTPNGQTVSWTWADV